MRRCYSRRWLVTRVRNHRSHAPTANSYCSPCAWASSASADSSVPWFPQTWPLHRQSFRSGFESVVRMFCGILCMTNVLDNAPALQGRMTASLACTAVQSIGPVEFFNLVAFVLARMNFGPKHEDIPSTKLLSATDFRPVALIICETGI